MRRNSIALDTAGDGEEGLWLAESTDYDVVVLDLMLPKLDGLSLLRKLRDGGQKVPVLLLTAKDAIEDRVRGLNDGADDYLTKPFALEELIARIHALYRRKYQQATARIQLGNLSIDTTTKTVRREDDSEVRLNPREYALLEFLALRRNNLVSRTEIEAHIYDGQVDPMSNVVDSAVCVLRRKLTEAEAVAKIRTRRGLGYILESD